MPLLTKRRVDAAAPDDREYFIWDDAISGLGLRVTPAGAKSFVFSYRAGHGRGATKRKPTIGRYGDVTVDEARRIARQWSAIATQGGDPSLQRQDKTKEPTLQDLFNDYLERHAMPHKREKSWKHDVSNFQNHVPESLKRTKIAELQTRDVEDMHRSIKDTPYQANRFLALLSKMFSLAIKWGWLTNNPCQDVHKFHEDKRERMLTPDEVTAFLEALSRYEQAATYKIVARRVTNALRLLLLTGARRNEVLSATWDQFDLTTGVWTKPSAHTKQKKVHRVPLSPVVVELLNRMRSEAGEGRYLFPASRGDSGHLQDPRKSWQAVKKLAGLEDIRIHDLRHSFASMLASSGESLLIIGALLGHTQPQTTARYAHLLDDPLREAAARVGAMIEGSANRKAT